MKRIAPILKISLIGRLLLLAGVATVFFATYHLNTLVQASPNPTDVPSFVRQIPTSTETSKYAFFYGPVGVAMAPDGSMYVLEKNFPIYGRVQKFASDGTYVLSFGTQGSGDGQFYSPYGITTDASGNVYVADTNNHRIQYFAYDSTAPALSSFSPASGSTITTATLTITFTTDEAATCRLSLSDESYDDMSDDVSCTGGGTSSQSCTTSDLGSDGVKSLYIACSDSTGNKDTVDSNTYLSYTLNSQAPALTLNSLTSPTSNTSPLVSGTATDNQGTISSVEYQVDSTSGTWLACVADDGSFNSSSETFSCTLNMSLSDGSHTIYVRATDNDSNTTLSGAEVTIGVTVDTAPPKKDFATIDPVSGLEFIKAFKQTNLNNLNVVGDTHYPMFCFTRAYDEGVGLSHYTIVVNDQDYLDRIPYVQPPIGDNGDTRQDGDSVIKENSDWYLRYHLYNTVSNQQEVCAYGKTDKYYLSSGVHSWSVKAVDKAGNSTSTDTLRFLVMTNQGTYSKSNQSVWFPLSLLQVGNRTNLTTYSTTTPELFTKETKPLTFSDSTPTFYGIAPVGATINLSLAKDTTDEAGNTNRQQVTTRSTNANDSSEWGINLDTPLTTGLYYLTVQSSDNSDNFAILKDIPIQLTNSTVATSPASNVDESGSEVLGSNDQATNWEEVDPSPTVKQPSPSTPPVAPTSTPTPQPKWWQFWRWF